jgi:hypothetical protein
MIKDFYEKYLNRLYKNDIDIFFGEGSKIVITSLVPTPNPIVTYTSFTLAGQLSNWLPSIYPSSLNLLYTTRYDNTTTSTSTTINSDGTFSYTNTETTLPGITVALSDSTTYGSGYVESNIFTLNSVPAAVNPTLNSPAYAVYNKSTNYNIFASYQHTHTLMKE